MSFHHTSAAILSIGDELSLGQSLDTNSRWIADRLMSLGVPTVEHVTIGDDQRETAETISRLAGKASLIISSGGLGPTLDDLTRQSLADVMGEGLVTDQDALAAIEARFASRGKAMSDLQRLQALRPAGARMLANPNGTAPGLHGIVRVKIDDGSDASADVYCLPGPPGEMKPMFEAQVAPSIRLMPGRRVMTRFVHLAGIGEGDAAARLGALMDRARVPLVGITASGGILTCRVRYEGTLGEADAARLVNETDAKIRAALGVHVFGDGETTTAISSVMDELRRRGETLACVESCTGGLLGERLTEGAGASSVFVGGMVTYSNELKRSLAHVPADLIAAHGAVSEPVARAMAVGGLEVTGSTWCVSITGIAGPAGGSATKPVGTVYIGLASRNAHGAREESSVQVRRFVFTGGRSDIRQRAAMSAVVMLLFALRGSLGGMRLLWESPERRSA